MSLQTETQTVSVLFTKSNVYVYNQSTVGVAQLPCDLWPQGPGGWGETQMFVSLSSCCVPCVYVSCQMVPSIKWLHSPRTLSDWKLWFTLNFFVFFPRLGGWGGRLWAEGRFIKRNRCWRGKRRERPLAAQIYNDRETHREIFISFFWEGSDCRAEWAVFLFAADLVLCFHLCWVFEWSHTHAHTHTEAESVLSSSSSSSREGGHAELQVQLFKSAADLFTSHFVVCSLTCEEMLSANHRIKNKKGEKIRGKKLGGKKSSGKMCI